METVTEYDLSQPLHTSGRIYRASTLPDAEILFNPDWRGLPIVVAPWVSEVLDHFKGGTAIGTVLATLPEREDPSDALDLIEYLEAAGYLRSSETPLRYTAGDSPQSSPRHIGIWLHVNNHCNLDCSYCFVNKFRSTMSPETVSRTVGHLVSTVRARGIREVALKFAGGEPTLSPETLESFHAQLTAGLEDIPGVRLFTSVLTNGTVLTPGLLSFYRRAKVTVAISLDGYGAESHDIHRVFTDSRKGSWDIIIRNVEKLKAAKSRFLLTQRSAATQPRRCQRWFVGLPRTDSDRA